MIRQFEYAELQTTTNFSFLRGASHPYELVGRAKELGYRAIGVTDYNTLAGVVRAHVAAKDSGILSLTGCRLTLKDKNEFIDPEAEYNLLSLLVYPLSRASYATLCRLLTTGKVRCGKNDFSLTLEEYLPYQEYFSTIVVAPFFQTRLHNVHIANFSKACTILKENAVNEDLLSLAITSNYSPRNIHYLDSILQISRALAIPLVATNDVYFHVPERRPLQDILSCIRQKTTIQSAGYSLFQHSERYLKPPQELYRLFREYPHALTRTMEVSEQASGFSLDSLRYEYPEEVCENGTSPLEYLTRLTWKGADERYPDGIPDKVSQLIREELSLIHELAYEKYFLTCFDIVRFARSKSILCQGRGAAANSVVCFCLGITSVNPSKIDLLFARFISKERSEPPDIDIDFEHERREEVIQYIYQKYGRDRAGLVCEVVTYRARSAVREVTKALGLSNDIADQLAKSIHRWTDCKITSDTLREIGLSPFDTTVLNALHLAREIIGFPRHLSQHVGGFIISQLPLCETVPILNAGMKDRTIIEWDKNDIEELGMLKIDILALGMLTCIRKALDLINRTGGSLALHTIPLEDPAVYDMVCRSDTVGVFQIESRAQMSMLPRLKPRCFYDLVIEVAIVRPGPIQGNMVHPYLRRRSGQESCVFPDERVRNILGKTLGVPIFQEQAMRLAIVLANFSPGEAEKLRRAMASWKTCKGVIETFKEKITKGMLENGYTRDFADTCLNQIKGFSEYGFPESHAASFALLAYASAWIKHHYPAEFCCALLNSQPMGFYAPSQIIQDAEKHNVTVRPIDATRSTWDSSLEGESIRLGLRLIKGLPRTQGEILSQQSKSADGMYSLWASQTGKILRKGTMRSLAEADGFTSLKRERRAAHWELSALPNEPAPLDAYFKPRSSSLSVSFTEMGQEQAMREDYRVTGFSLRAHPLQFVRSQLHSHGVLTAADLSPSSKLRAGSYVAVAGLAIIRQRPGTAKGVVFITLEDETGIINLIIRPAVFDEAQKAILTSSTLMAHGKLQRIGEVLYVEADRVTETDSLFGQNRNYPNRSYSY